MAQDINLKEQVHNALDRSVVNCIELSDWTLQEIVTDLKDCDPDYEIVPREILEPIVAEWLEKNND